MRTLYNDIDPFAAGWLRNLIDSGELPAGTVDDRSIAELTGADLEGIDDVHFFAGIGGWPIALRLAGWSGPVWTGSCPCQPFSRAGKRRGTDDDRHLWPEMFRLIRECRPATVFGEQVAGKAALGWLDGISADLEGEGYAVGSVVMGAHSVGAPHIRQRLFWVADSGGGKLRRDQPGASGAAQSGVPRSSQKQRLRSDAGAGGAAESLASRPTPQASAWSDSITIPCRDGKHRRISAQPGDEPLAHGIPRDVGSRFPRLAGVARGARRNRVGRLKGYGNAIVPQLAAEFVRAFMSKD